MALENCREYLRQLKEDVKNEGVGKERYAKYTRL